MAAKAYRAIGRIERKAEVRAYRLAEDLVRLIALYAPRDPHHETNTGGPPLWKSYYVRIDPETGDSVVKCRRRYWVYVEYGTREHGDAQPHVRPALRALKRVNQ
jgi:hypothetical protein